MEALFQLGLFVILLTAGFFFGSSREKKHYKSILERQKKYAVIATRSEKIRDFSPYSDAMLVTGSVVIASDYFKNFVASIKNLFGGRLNSFESLMDRGRRESVLRMKENASHWGADEILEVRLESSALDAIGIEVFAYGTAVKKRKSSDALA